MAGREEVVSMEEGSMKGGRLEKNKLLKQEGWDSDQPVVQVDATSGSTRKEVLIKSITTNHYPPPPLRGNVLKNIMSDTWRKPTSLLGNVLKTIMSDTRRVPTSQLKMAGRKMADQASRSSDQPVIAAEEAEKMSTVDQVDSTTSGLTRREKLIKSITDAKDNETSQSRTTITRKIADQASRSSDQPVIATEEAEKMSTVDQVDSTTSGLTRREKLIKSITDAEDNETSQSRTTITRKIADQASRSSDQPVIATEEAEKMSTVDQVDSTTSGLTRREKLIKSITDAKDNETSQSRTTITRIQKLPGMPHGTNDFEKYFVPRVISIGPYHHNKDELKSAEIFKFKFTDAFIDDKHQQMSKVYNEILKDIKKLRDCYDKKPTNEYGDQELAWMLFVDGCFVLQYIHCSKYGGLDDWMIKDRRVAFVCKDLFLLENQLPFQVLRLLTSAKYDDSWEAHEGMKKIEPFIQMNSWTPEKWPPQLLRWIQLSLWQQSEEHSHLLDLLRKSLIGKTNKNAAPKVYRAEELPLHIWNSFCNVTELTAVGIHLKPSNTNYLSDVSFIPHWITGHLKLPPIFIDNSTKPMFLNLIAYEMCPNVHTDLEVTSYVCFLASLINHSDDVKILREARILHNFLGSDEEVAKLFNEIAAGLVSNPHVYEDVKLQIQLYLSERGKSKMASWFAEVIRRPWNTIAVLVGFIAISVTIVQTYFTIFPLPE